MCKSCGKVIYTQPSVQVDASGYYRTSEYVKVVYNGASTIRVEGCMSHTRYIFLPGRTRDVDKNDAVCIMDLEGFEYAGMDGN